MADAPLDPQAQPTANDYTAPATVTPGPPPVVADSGTESAKEAPAPGSSGDNKAQVETDDNLLIQEVGNKQEAKKVEPNSSNSLLGLANMIAPLPGSDREKVIDQQLKSKGDATASSTEEGKTPDGSNISVEIDSQTKLKTEGGEGESATGVSESSESGEVGSVNSASGDPTPYTAGSESGTAASANTETPAAGTEASTDTPGQEKPKSTLEDLRDRAKDEIKERAEKYVKDKAKKFYEDRVKPKAPETKPGQPARAPGSATPKPPIGTPGATPPVTPPPVTPPPVTPPPVVGGVALEGATAAEGAAAVGTAGTAAGAGAAGAAGAAAGSVVPVVGTIVVGTAAYVLAKRKEESDQQEAEEKTGPLDAVQQQAQEQAKKMAKEAADQAKEAAKEAAKKAAKQAIQKAGKKIATQLATKNPWVLGAIAVVLAIVILILLIVVIFAWRDASAPRGDIPTSSFAMNSGVVDATWANPEGLYMEEMTTTLTTEKGAPIFIGATSGGFSCEESAVVDVNNNGRVYLPSTGKSMAFQRKYDGSGFTQSEINYYAVGRWPYTKTSWWDEGQKARYSPNRAYKKSEYGGRKIIVYSVKHRKAAVAIIAEFGPAPWTGTGRTQSRAIDANLWKNGPHGTEPRIDTPIGYTGRIGGGSPDVGRAIGIINNECDSPVIIGFLKDQDKYPVGYTFDKPDLKKLEAGLLPTKNVNLGVPGIAEGSSTECAAASIATVATYYQTINKKTYEDYPAALKSLISKGGSGGASFTTTSNTCHSASFLNGLGLKRDGKDASGWVERDLADIDSVAWAARSVVAGDPVIISQKAGAADPIKDLTYVLSGWNSAEQEFYVTVPTVGGAAVGVRGSQLPSGKPQTPGLLFTNKKENKAGYTMLIRSIYVK